MAECPVCAKFFDGPEAHRRLESHFYFCNRNQSEAEAAALTTLGSEDPGDTPSPSSGSTSTSEDEEDVLEAAAYETYEKSASSAKSAEILNVALCATQWHEEFFVSQTAVQGIKQDINEWAEKCSAEIAQRVADKYGVDKEDVHAS